MKTIKAIVRKEYKLSSEELGFPSVARAVLLDCEVAGVLVVSRQDDGYFYWIFCDSVKDEETIEIRDAFVNLLHRNELNGYSCGAYETISDLNSALKKEGITGYGMFEDF